MNNQPPFTLKPCLLLLAMLLFTSPAFPQSAPMAYQGRLTEAGNPSTDLYEMEFKLFDTPDVGTGTPQGATVSNAAVAASDGVFTVLLDFGVAVFDGSPRYLEISVKKAGSADPFSTLTPRQAITPVPYAIRTLSAGPAAGGVTSDAGGNVAIGTGSFPAGVRLNVDGATRVSPGGTGGYVQIGTPGGETGLSVLGENRADLRFNGQTLALGTGPNAGPTPYQNGIVINTNGNVGIGMGAPFLASQWKLQVNGPTRLTPGGPGAVQFSTPNGETGMSILGANRADIRFDDATLKLVAGPGNGTPGNASGLAIDTAGNVGIGTTTPATKLSVRGNADFSASVSIGPVINPTARLEIKSDTQPAIHAESTLRSVPAVYAWNQEFGRAIHAEGHSTQQRGAGGFVKAMAVIEGASIVRCFSAVSSALFPAALSTSPCGLEITRRFGDSFKEFTLINFGFRVDDRFVVVTTGRTATHQTVANLEYAPNGNPNEVAVLVSYANGDELEDGERTIPFTVVVY